VRVEPGGELALGEARAARGGNGADQPIWGSAEATAAAEKNL